MKKPGSAKRRKSILSTFFDDIGNKSASTISGYKTAIWQFIQFTYSLPDSDKERVADLVDQYFAEERDPHADFKKFIQKKLADKPPLSARQVFNQIKKFLELCDVIFTAKELLLLKNQLPAGGVETQESDLDTDAIRSILQHTDIKGKAIILCLASGGMRIGELLEVRCSDVDLDAVPAVVQIRAKNKRQTTDENGDEQVTTTRTKTRRGRYTFISSEAVAAVREWLKTRSSYLQTVQKKANHLNNVKQSKDITDERLFPISDNTVNQLFIEAVTAAFGENEVDPNTGRSVRHIHQLRKFFISQLSLATSESVADFFAGHKTAMSDNYRRYTQKQMSEYYLKGEHLLFIEAPAELREMGSAMKKELANLKDETLKNNSTMISLLAKNDQLNDAFKQQQIQVEVSSKKNLELEEKISTLEATIAENQREMKRMIYALSDMDEYPSRPYDDPHLTREKRNELIDEEIKAVEKHWEEVNSGKREFAPYNPKPNNPK
jgi:integrase